MSQVKRLIFILLVMSFAQSCKTYNYTYSSKETSLNKNLVTYYNPKVETNYSIVPYVSVLGVGLGGGYLLGNHVQNNMINAGASKDTAELHRNIIYLAGAFAAGYGIYYLVNDSSASEEKYIFSTSNEINEWYSSVVDFDDYKFIGTKNNRVYALKDTKLYNLISDNKLELVDLYKKFTKPQFYELRDSIMINSFSEIPKFQHYKLYKDTDKKYDVYLSECLDELILFDRIIEYANDVKKSNVYNKDRMLIESARKSYLKLIETENDKLYKDWLNTFGGLNYLSLNDVKDDVKNRLVIINAKNEEREKQNRLRKEEEERLAELKRQEEARIKNERILKAELEAENLRTDYKNEANTIFNKVIKSRSKFVNNLQLGDCVSIMKLRLIDMNNGSFELLEYMLNTIMVGLKKSILGDFNNLVNDNSIKDGKYLISINDDYGIAMDILTCKCIVKKIDKKTNQVLIKVINGSEKCYSKDEHFINAYNLIPCGG